MNRALFIVMSMLVHSAALLAQSTGATVTGQVSDATGAQIVGVEVVLKSTSSELVRKQITDQTGTFSFPNIQQGGYELEATAKGFKVFTQKNIVVRQYENVRVPVTLELGETSQRVEVVASVSALNVETPEVKGTLPRREIESLPLQVAGGQRSAATFVTLLPGVSPGGGQSDAFQARFNGGQRFSDEAILDGVTMQEGLLSQSGMVAIQNDFPIAPEAVNEISVLTSNYDVQFGASSAAVIIASTKSGTNEFHGGGYLYHRNSAFNARPWNATTRPFTLQNDFGGFIGGPAKFKPLWTTNVKTYFFAHIEGFRSVGATTAPVLTLPTERMRRGDFSEWRDGQGNLIPIFDPDTTRPNPAYNAGLPTGPNNLPYLRNQFMGCDGTQPNVICPSDSRLQTSLAQGWLNLLPQTNRPGTVANYQSDRGLASSLFANTNQYDFRLDSYLGEKDHLSGTYHYRGTLEFIQWVLPRPLDTNNTRYPNYSHIIRANWDRTFSATLFNNFNFGYLDLPTNVVNSSDCCVDELPKIQGVYDNQKHGSGMRFGDGYAGFTGVADFYTTRPTYAFNDSVSWVKGRHQLKFGGEFRNVAYPTFTEENGSGTFTFNPDTTGLRGIVSGNAMASFLLGTVSSASIRYYSLPRWKPTGYAYGLFVGDQIRVTSRLNVNAGLRWDVYKPSMEAEDQMSFFDPTGPNPGAGGRLGRLAFAGNGWGEASFGRRAPETTYYGAFAPRLGFAFTLRPRTVIRVGAGVFFMQNFYPGWNGGVATDGFNQTAAFSAGLGGLEPAFLLQNGVPQTFAKPPFVDPSFSNGLNAPNYRPFDSNELPRSQQWNFTVEHQVTNDLYVSAGYVGNKGTRLLSQVNPINVLNPQLLSMREQLFDQFGPGQTELHGVRIPYAGWGEQMRSCPPSVAQALMPFPQYCGGIYGQNENVGNSTYHSFQLKLEHRFHNGLFFLTSYTWSKTLTSTDSAQSGSQNPRLFSPFEMKRNKALADQDQPHVFSTAVDYQLPFGRGKKFGGNVNAFVNYLIGGWELSGIFRANSGLPVRFSSSFCNVPSQFQAACVPGLIPGQDPLLQDNSNFDPGSPRYNIAALEPASSFNFYWGQGTRYTNVRGFPYTNFDISMFKNILIAERVRIQLRFESFNTFNQHIFTSFETNVASPNFGRWTGGVSAPRNFQLGSKITF